ncbi:MAG: hypothetical protein Fur0025_23220 [Oscillatoriaceae cyanobacterium]
MLKAPDTELLSHRFGPLEKNPLGKDNSGNTNRQDDVNLRQLIYTYITTADGQFRNCTCVGREAWGSQTCRCGVKVFWSVEVLYLY